MSDDTIPGEAVDFLRRSNDWHSHNRQEWLDDLNFSFGQQWSVQMQNTRHLDGRPWFVVNETDTYIRQVCNQIRQQRPRGVAHGINNQADEKIAQIITGVSRHIDQISDADVAYDTAVNFQVRMGIGYWRLVGEYCGDKSFDQDIKVKPVYNPFTVGFDPHSRSMDGSDQMECMISDMISKEVFRQEYPDADESNFTFRAVGDITGDWIEKDSIRVAEYYKIERQRDILIKTSDGNTFWKNELPDPELLKKVGVKVVGDRESWRKLVKWYKCTAVQTIDSRTLPGIYIPVVPVYGEKVLIEGKERIFGMTRGAKDPQRMINFWNTSTAEIVAMAAKAKWLVGEGQIEGFEKVWEQANVSNYAYLPYKTSDDSGNPMPAPIRIQPEPPPEGAMSVAANAHLNLQRVMGMIDPAQRIAGNASGKALNADQQNSDISNFHFYDNFTRGLKHSERIKLSWIRHYYPERRVMRIIGDDGKPDMITINDTQAVGKIENDVTVGEYDVVMETGPGYNSKRQEAYAMMTDLAKAYPPLMQIAGDLLFRNSDMPGADVIADRMAAQNPLAQIDDKSEVPPAAQMKIKQQEQAIQQLQQQLQQAGLLIKTRGDVVAHQEAGETHRMEIKEREETKRRFMENESYKEVEHTKAFASLGSKELEGIIKILTQAKDHAHERDLAVFEAATSQQEAETSAKSMNGAQ